MDKLAVIKNFIEASRAIQEIGHIGVAQDLEKIHFQGTDLIDLAKEFDKKLVVEDRQDDKFPYKAMFEIDGILIYAIYDKAQALKLGLIKEAVA